MPGYGGLGWRGAIPAPGPLNLGVNRALTVVHIAECSPEPGAGQGLPEVCLLRCPKVHGGFAMVRKSVICE